MIELFEVDSPHDRRIAQAASGLLRTFNEAGVFTAATSMSRAGSVPSLGVPDESCCSPWRWPCARCAAGRCAST